MDLQHESMVNDLFVISKQINKSTTYQSKVMYALLYVFLKDGIVIDPESPLSSLISGNFNDILAKSVFRDPTFESFSTTVSEAFRRATLVGKFNHMQATAFLESIKHEMEA